MNGPDVFMDEKNGYWYKKIWNCASPWDADFAYHTTERTAAPESQGTPLPQHRVVRSRETARCADTTGPRGPRECELDLSAMRAALPDGSYDDEVLDLKNHLDDDDDEIDRPPWYPDEVRAKRIVEVCSAAHLAVLIDAGLVGNREDFKVDENAFSPGSAFGAEPADSLLEHVMPNLEKMHVCLVRGNIDMHISALINARECGGDKICAYLDIASNDPKVSGESLIAGIKLLLKYCDYNPVNYITCSVVSKRLTRPGTREFLDEMDDAPSLGTSAVPIGFARISKVLAAQRERRALQLAFLGWSENAGTFAPGGVGFKRDREMYESGKLLA